SLEDSLSSKVSKMQVFKPYGRLARKLHMVKTKNMTKYAALFPKIMPPKMLKRKAVKKMVKNRVAKAIAEYEKTKANPDNAG
nr:hypothetical protein [Tanacetum cinerariifolium]